MAYRTHGRIRRNPLCRKKSWKIEKTNINRNEINIMNIINDNTFNQHKSLLNNDNRSIKVTL